MRKTEFTITDPREAGFLAQVIVRRVLPRELARCRQAVCEKHYLKSADLVGEQLWYVAERQGQWLALLGWSAAAYHLKGRDAWIGWNDTQRRARLWLLANNARFCLLTPAGDCPNLASYVMGQCLQRLSQDWQQAYGHPILAVESFVDTQLFRGTCYKATGWQAVGCTAGFQRVAQDFYQVHDRPKQLFVRELVKHAARTLRGRELPAALAGYERKVKPRCLLALEPAGSLRQVLPPAGARNPQRAWPAAPRGHRAGHCLCLSVLGRPGRPPRGNPLCPGFVADATGGLWVLVQPQEAPL